MNKLLVFLFLPLQLFAQPFSNQEISRWEKEVKNITIIRDNWGIPHIYGKTDADAVFGLLYTQCEDDFKRVEMNYIEKLGRIAEVKGEPSLYDDLLIRMIIDTADAKADYNKSPAWLKKLLVAFADGINYYLYKHPGTTPALLYRFQPWYPLLWTDGSIGAISTADVTVNELKNLYSGSNSTTSTNEKKDASSDQELTGSNGFAFAPSITVSGNAILYINPHVTFYFRPEVHMVSEEGLNVYGAVTWGQFFVYQGFNEHCGWMHTSSDVDAADSYIEQITAKNKGWVYTYNHQQRPVIEKKIVLKYKKGEATESKTITVLFTHHGPVMAKRNGNWISVRADNRIMNGLVQCWQRNKTKSFADYKKTMDLLGNISNNTVYADAEGNIAYWHGNRIPVRDTKYDWSKPVDGTIKATEWKRLHKVAETIHLYNPTNGWLQNCNSTPYTVAGNNSPKKENYPFYMAPDKENFRGINAVRVLGEENKYSIDKVIKAGYDTRLAAFEVLIPALIHRYEISDITGPDLTGLKEAMNILKAWDYRCSDSSIATSLAIHFGEKISPMINQLKIPGNENAGFVEKTKEFSKRLPEEILFDLVHMLRDLEKKYGKWNIPWGDINRFQRISSDIDNKFDDSKSSIPVGFVSSTWGMLPSYSSRAFPGTKIRYGVNGNSFICAVEFVRKDSLGGKKIKAKSLLAGGESGDPNSKHFTDQAMMYTKGVFKDVLFYKEDILKHAERTYHPGE